MVVLGVCDLTANIWFVKTIRRRLINLGLHKVLSEVSRIQATDFKGPYTCLRLQYDALVRYNILTLGVSLCLDGVVIGM